MISMIQGAVSAVTGWMFKGVNDEYVDIRHAAPKLNAAQEIPQSLRERDIPDFGLDQERMLKMAVKNFSNEDLQVKWLHSMYRLRYNTGSGWLAETHVPHARHRRVARPDGFFHPGVFVLEDSDRYLHQDHVPGEGIRMMVENSIPNREHEVMAFSQIDHERITKLFDELSKPVKVGNKPGLTLVK